MQKCLLLLLTIGSAAMLSLTAAAASSSHAAAINSLGITPDGGLLDSYIQLSKPQVSLSDKQSGRDGRTTLTVKLTDSSVSKFTPVVSPQTQGVTIDILNTWDAFKNMAQAFRRADEVNQRKASKPRVFPRTSLAARAATVAPPPQLDRTFAASETPNPTWFVSFPPNLLFVPFGKPIAAIADVLDISYDDKAATVNLQLDVVNSPTAFSQFIPGHTSHSLDTAAAHYHFATRPGMTVDAPALLKSLKDSSHNLEGLHVFFKSEPLAQCPYEGAFKPAGPETITVGSSLQVTITANPAGKCAPAQPDLPDTAFVAWNGPWTVLPVTEQGMRRRPQNDAKIPLTCDQDTLVCNGVFDLRADEPDTVVLKAYFIGKSTDAFPPAFTNEPLLTVTAIAAPAPVVAKVVLLPAKAYRYCGDPISLTAIAYTSADVPVPNTNISFAIFGDCAAQVDITTVLTNANGAAVVNVNAHKPGATAVVAAAAAGANGAVVISAPAHVIYFNDRDYIDRREREYFGHEHERDGDDYWRRDRAEHHGDHDAWRYGHEATMLAQERALGTPVSVNNQNMRTAVGA